MSTINDENVSRLISDLEGINSSTSSSELEGVLTESYELINQIKQQNRETMDKMKSIFDELKDNNQNNSEANSESIQNLNNLKNLYKTTQKQNDNNMKSFLENYLYVIVKVISMIIVFFIAYKFSSFSLPAFELNNMKDKAMSVFSNRQKVSSNNGKNASNPQPAKKQNSSRNVTRNNVMNNNIINNNDSFNLGNLDNSPQNTENKSRTN